MDTTDRILAKVLYGALFALIVPLFLVVWAIGAEPNVGLPAIDSTVLGLIGAVLGGSLMISGYFSLFVYGKGLPMNPFPPRLYVTRGIYRFTSHPIYAGFSILCIGLSMLFGSSSGLWLVSPIVILSCVALVQGFEKERIRNLFGSNLPKPLIRIPGEGDDAPDAWERVSAYVLVLLPWTILYQAVRFFGTPPDAIIAALPFEETLPVYESTEIFYISTYLFVFLAPLVARSKSDLRDFSIYGLISTAIVSLLFLTVPLIAPPRPFVAEGFWGNLLLFERAHDTPAAAFPSFHVIWALLAARVYARRIPSLRIFSWGWALLISVSCITTGMHTVIDVVAGFVFFFFLVRIRNVYECLRKSSERIANSWREWNFKSIRIINHGVYPGIGTFVGLCIAGFVTGSGHITAVLIVAMFALITSALWAQFIEGSAKLLRPYGYYGGVLGLVLGTFVASLTGSNTWLLLAAFSVAGPWIQSFGRIRCLIQGCCHGHETTEEIGIRYEHPRSRVNLIAGLAGKSIHPTPLYSILWNIVIAFVLTRLWVLETPLSLIGGGYLILTGLGRFVEEAFRGEPQTPIKAGLRLYQWIALGSVIAGAVVTMIPTSSEQPVWHLSPEMVLAAGVTGCIMFLALGMDFPQSNKRFSRLV